MQSWDVEHMIDIKKELIYAGLEPEVTCLFFSLKLSAVDRVGKRSRDQKRGLPWVSDQRGGPGKGGGAERP